MRTSAGGNPADAPVPEKSRQVVAGIARGAVVVAGLTLLSRFLGLVRTLVFSQTVGVSCLGTAYVTAYQVPNLLYELILGGALTGAMIPVLARPAKLADADPAEKARVEQITSALLTWSVVILLPLAVAVTAAARPIAALLIPANRNTACVREDMINVTGRMLEVFAPQIVLYGLSVVLYGLLQAYRRFVGPTLGPAISSVVVIAACLAFVPLGGRLPLAKLPQSAELVLAAGTTLGIAALVVAGAVPTWRLRLRIRPAWRFPAGVARWAGGLALVGVVEIIASELASVVSIALANGRGSTGAIVILNYSSQMFGSVSAVLAISVVISAFPVMSVRDGAEFDRTCATSTRAVLLLSLLGTAVIAALSVPAARVLARQPDQVPELIETYALVAPGIAGTAVIANLSRAMFVIGRLTVAAVAVAGSWLLVIVADVLLAELLPARLVAPGLALGTTLGQTVAAIPLVLVTRRMRGPAAVRGAGRATLAGMAAAAVAAAVGVAACLAVPTAGKLATAGVAVVAVLGAVIAFGAVAYTLDRDDLTTVTARLRRPVRRPS